ncbi:uncharacterized protein LOC107047689 [Diachasma alloeum]|uniref:uncharacterized protein LOC107047689 n=1 Tax=Diachasma alloeum TaxID=454923 RepID=UPI0007383B24|nr:uncharacterized protein LOC107047689 [Diachasma alloeum]
MRVFILLSILGTSLIYCEGSHNASADGVDNSTKSTTRIHRTFEPDRYRKHLNAHESLLHRFLFPERMHDNVKKSPLVPFVKDLTDGHENETGKNPRNVILVLLEGAESYDQWLKFKDNATLLTEGVLQKCSKQVSLRNVSESGKVNCEWKQMLKDGINDLLLWARQTKHMSIGTVSGGNFTLPSVFHFENPPLLPPKIFNKPQEIPLSFLEPSTKLDNYSVNNSPANANHSGVGIPLTFNPYSTEGEVNEEPWDFLDVVSRIRFAVFRTFLDSLHGAFGRNDGDTPQSGIFTDKFPKHSSGIVDIVANTLQDLQTIPSESGYLLIAVATSQELFEISELLRRMTSINDTLVILTALQNNDDRGIPVFTSGPGSTLINKTHTIYDIPKVIKWTLENAREIHQDRPPLSLSLHDTPRRRVARSDDEDETVDEMNVEENPPEISSETSSSEGNTETECTSSEGTTTDFVPEPRSDSASCAVGLHGKILDSFGFAYLIISILKS